MCSLNMNPSHNGNFVKTRKINSAEYFAEFIAALLIAIIYRFQNSYSRQHFVEAAS